MNLKEKLTEPSLKKIGVIADSIDRECYVVGGYVRDLMLDRPSKDIDFVTVGSGIELAETVARSLGPRTHLAVYRNYGTAQVLSLIHISEPTRPY